MDFFLAGGIVGLGWVRLELESWDGFFFVFEGGGGGRDVCKWQVVSLK